MPGSVHWGLAVPLPPALMLMRLWVQPALLLARMCWAAPRRAQPALAVPWVPQAQRAAA
jgi:hypothetical protein